MAGAHISTTVSGRLTSPSTPPCRAKDAASRSGCEATIAAPGSCARTRAASAPTRPTAPESQTLPSVSAANAPPPWRAPDPAVSTARRPAGSAPTGFEPRSTRCIRRGEPAAGRARPRFRGTALYRGTAQRSEAAPPRSPATRLRPPGPPERRAAAPRHLGYPLSPSTPPRREPHPGPSRGPIRSTAPVTVPPGRRPPHRTGVVATPYAGRHHRGSHPVVAVTRSRVRKRSRIAALGARRATQR
jgi:hypothetical protein